MVDENDGYHRETGYNSQEGYGGSENGDEEGMY